MSTVISQWIAEIREALSFLSRLPASNLGAVPEPGRRLGPALRFAPVAGVVIALGPALLLGAMHRLGVPSLAIAALTVAASALVTGALHEDGLSDVADGFGGGATRERKLAIMRDSRIGAFGALALGVGLILRIACLQASLDRHGALAAAALWITAAALSRALMLVPMALLPPARSDGLAHAAGAIDPSSLWTALLLGLVLGGLAAVAGHHTIPRFAVAAGSAGLVALAMTGLARRQIGGVTGDVVGASQQASEIAVLLVLSADG